MSLDSKIKSSGVFSNRQDGSLAREFVPFNESLCAEFCCGELERKSISPEDLMGSFFLESVDWDFLQVKSPPRSRIRHFAKAYKGDEWKRSSEMTNDRFPLFLLNDQAKPLLGAMSSKLDSERASRIFRMGVSNYKDFCDYWLVDRGIPLWNPASWDLYFFSMFCNLAPVPDSDRDSLVEYLASVGDRLVSVYCSDLEDYYSTPGGFDDCEERDLMLHSTLYLMLFASPKTGPRAVNSLLNRIVESSGGCKDFASVFLEYIWPWPADFDDKWRDRLYTAASPGMSRGEIADMVDNYKETSDFLGDRVFGVYHSTYELGDNSVYFGKRIEDILDANELASLFNFHLKSGMDYFIEGGSPVKPWQVHPKGIHHITLANRLLRGLIQNKFPQAYNDEWDSLERTSLIQRWGF